MTPEVLEATRLWTLAVPTVSAFVTSLVRDFQERDDVLQETAVAVLESFPRYDASRSFVGWTLSIARNQVRPYCRWKGRQRLAFDSDAVNALARAFADGEPSDQRLDHLGLCVQALDRLIEKADTRDRSYVVRSLDERPEESDERRPPLDGATLPVRYPARYLLVRRFPDGRAFVTGSDGERSWAVPPTGAVE